jgi:hypothetical protein
MPSNTLKPLQAPKMQELHTSKEPYVSNEVQDGSKDNECIIEAWVTNDSESCVKSERHRNPT